MEGPIRIPERWAVLRARGRVLAAVNFLREDGRTDELHLIEGSLSFEMGAIHALDWVLGLNGSPWFERHLDALKLIEHKLKEAVRNDGGTAGRSRDVR